MEEQISFLAEQQKNIGMTLAMDKANREHERWSERAYDYLRSYLHDVSGDFMGEDVRNYAHARGLPRPHSARAWGAVINKAAHDGVIVFVRYAKTVNPTAHRTPAAVWRKA